MTDQLHIRDVPSPIHAWVEDERRLEGKTQNDFLLKLLEESRARKLQIPLFRDQRTIDLANPTLPFTFIDLFAGIGGLRLGLERVGGTCVFSSEWDKYAQRTYKAWFGETPEGDIRKIRPIEIPDHDIMAAGFPCQPFSIAGVSKKNSLGREHGFKDQTQGTLFFTLATIIEAKRPAVLVLENVRNLLGHDQGRTWAVIKGTLEDMQYHVFHQVIDAKHWVPQHRERVFIVCFDKHEFPIAPPFVFPEKPENGPKLKDILETKVDKKYTLTDHLWDYLQKYAARHKAQGNGFGFSLADPEGVTRTLSARYFKDGSEILIPQGKKKNPRRLTPTECRALMGFPPELQPVVSDTQAYKQFGNAVVPPVAEAVMREVVRVLAKHLTKEGRLFKRRPVESVEDHSWPHTMANTQSKMR